jgi:hypothetical protein
MANFHLYENLKYLLSQQLLYVHLDNKAVWKF